MGFACGDGECCGQVCKAEGDLCCKKGKPGYEYPVAEGTACTSDSVTCINSNGNEFQCGAGSTCCGDICSGPGGVCCKGSSSNFVCGPGSQCCGNTCKAPGSKCCRTKGLNYAVTKGTKCAGWNSGSIVCTNRYGAEFLCGAHSSCCGDLCAGAGGVCCQNEQGHDFVCGAGSRCGKNVCLADH